MEQVIEMTYATIECVSPKMTVVHIHPEVKLTTGIICGLMRKRRAHVAGTSAVILIIPEFTDYDPEAMTLDHYAENGMESRTSALAIVCQEHGLVDMLHLYFAFYPPAFEVKFCDTVPEAHRWLTERATSTAA